MVTVQGRETFKRQDNPVQVIIHDIPLATVQGLAATPFTLVPAPTTGEFTEVLSITSIYTAGGTAATLGADTNLHIAYTDTTTAVPDVLVADVFNSANIVDWGAIPATIPLTVVGTAVQLSADSGSVTAGNGRLRVIVRLIQHNVA